MDAQQAENLRILIRYMETRPVERLYMGSVTTHCGTPACAMGHARTCDALLKRGMETMGLTRVAVGFFGMTDGGWPLARSNWGRLFGASLRVYKDGGDERFTTINDPTPQEWAVEARKVLSDRGYSMDDAEPAPAQDAFAAFMAKVQEPVAVTA